MTYSLGFSRWNTDGISAASEKNGNTEKDGYKNTSLYSTLGFTPTDNSDLNFNLRFTDALSNIDSYGMDDPNYTEETRQVFFRTQGHFSLFKGIWEHKLGFSVTDHDRYSRDDTDVDHPVDASLRTYNGQIFNFDWQNNVFIHDANTLTFGIETEEEKGKSYLYSDSMWGPYESTFVERTARTTGFYLQDHIKLWDTWYTTAGVRWDHHSMFGTEATFRITSALLVQKTGTTFKGSFGTGFKSPTLYQLYSDEGDENLNPEESAGWDLGVEQSLFENRATFGTTVFHNDVDPMIDFDLMAWEYFNTAGITKGVEIFSSVQPVDNLTFRFSYTYTNTKDKNTNEKLIRRPNNKFNIDMNYSYLEKGNFNLEMLYVGERDNEVGFPPQRVKMDSYVLVNPAFSYKLSRNVQAFGRIDNLFDRDYEEVTGYGTPGFTAYGGIKVTFTGM